jgi:hypothetical protein
LGWQIVHWIWEDLYHPEELRRRLERALRGVCEPRDSLTPHLLA